MCVSDPFDYQVLNLSPKFYRDYPETKYIDNYVNQISGFFQKYDEKEFQRIYQYATLQYFHKELGI